MADVQTFIATYLPAAQLAAAQLGTDPANILGQWGLETGWGKSVIPGTHNLGNIKSTNGQGVSAKDNQLGTTDTYASYSSPTDAAQSYASLLLHPRYDGVVGSAGQPQAFVNGVVNGGYAEDPHYGSKLTSAIDTVQQTGAVPTLSDMKAQLAQQVTEDYAHGVDPATIVQGLMQTKLAGPDVMAALKKGVTPDRIIEVVGGPSLAQFKATDPAEQVKQQGFLTNAVQGAGNAIGDLGRGAEQLRARITGDDGQLAQLQQQQAQIDADPARQALNNTWGGTIGSAGVKALPYIAATAVAPEGVIPMALANGAVGAADGALRPTTGNGQFGSDIVQGAVTGGAGAAGGALAGKAVGGALRMFGGDAEATARLAAAQEQGLPATVGGVSGPDGFWRNVLDRMPNNSSVQGAQSAADAAVAKKVASALGLQDYAGPIDTGMLNAARPAIKQALDDATNVQVTLPQSLKTDLQAIGNRYSNPLTEGITQTGTVQRAVDNLSKAADAGTAVSGRDLQGLASELKDVLYNQSASHQEKQLASAVVNKINSTLTDAMTPEQQQAFATANDQYKHLLAVQKQVALSNDSGVVSPRQMIQAAKTGSFKNAFLSGNAPFQDLATTAADLYGPANGRGLGSVLSKQLGGDDHGLLAAAVLEPHTGIAALAAKKVAGALLGKIAASNNPILVRALTGAGRGQMSPVVQAYIAKALGGTGAALGAGSQ